MRSEAIAVLGICVFFIAGVWAIEIAYADVPSVFGLTREVEGGGTTLVVEVRHNDPSSTHYINTVEIDVDGKVDRKTNLTPQTATTFKLRYPVDAGAKKIQVRVNCNVHGWSPWASEEQKDGSGGGIPGFPYGSVVLGITLGMILLWVMRRRS